MKRKEPSSAVDDETTLKKSRTTLFDNHKSRVTAVRCTSFPEGISRIVGEYSSDRVREYVVAALLGVQPITLCLSQDVAAELGSCWSLGFLPPDHPWGSRQVKVDKQFTITDVKGCLCFLSPTNTMYCPMAVEVLVVKLSRTSSDSGSALDDLRTTIGELQRHLNSIKHVVFSITKDSCCCFTLKSTFNDVTGVSLPVDHLKVLLQIIDDLETCWSATRTLSPQGLFAFYFTSGIQRASEKYLAKFVISLNHRLKRASFGEEAFQMQSNKIMWVISLESTKDFVDFQRDATHVVRDRDSADIDLFAGDVGGRFGVRRARASYYHSNLFIERIVMNTPYYSDYTMLFPRPSASLIDNTPLSALVELTLMGSGIKLHLTQLNNGYFPHLAHLTVIAGSISGHLDSDRVPCLETLRITSRDSFTQDITKKDLLMEECAQSLIHAGRPWQLVAAKQGFGWSLASYDSPAYNSLNDEKEDGLDSHLLPLIRELLLVMHSQSHADEWQAQLRGNPSLEAAAGDHSDRLLVWAPQCVQKLTAFCLSGLSVKLKFKVPILEQTHILTSFTSYNVDVALDGAVLPNLRSLELNGGKVKLSGAFPLLEALFFVGAHLKSRWHVNAPFLHSFGCHDTHCFPDLSLDLHSLPHLSFFHIEVDLGYQYFYPKIIISDNNLGLSPIKHVVFDEGMSLSPFFEEYQVNNVLHLELMLDPFRLPACWYNTVWQCETLTVDVCAPFKRPLNAPKQFVAVELPPLPRVKALTVREQDCRVLLNREMLELTECTVTSPSMLRPQLRCPSLEIIRFTGELSESDKEHCLNPATYLAIGAQPRKVYFDDDCEVHTMT